MGATLAQRQDNKIKVIQYCSKTFSERETQNLGKKQQKHKNEIT